MGRLLGVRAKPGLEVCGGLPAAEGSRLHTDEWSREQAGSHSGRGGNLDEMSPLMALPRGGSEDATDTGKPTKTQHHSFKQGAERA